MSKTIPSTILWDNDGILVDTEHLYFRATCDVLEEEGFHLSKERYIELLLVQSKGVWHLLEEDGPDPDRIPAAKRKRNALYAHYLESEPILIDGARETLEQLHGRFKMGIVTSSLKHHFDIIHGRSKLLDYFDFVITSEDVERTKPDPEPYVTALRLAGVQPHEAVAVEDSERGLRAALAAGIPCYIIPTELTRHSNFDGALEILDTIQQVAERILERAST